MWSAESNASTALALLRVPLASFSDGRDSAPRSSYRGLPGVAGYALQNRFVGQYLLYGGGAGWRRPQSMDDPRAFAVRYARPEMAQEIVLEHGVDRIEALGNDAVLVGSDGRDLHFTSLRLGRVPSAAGHYVRANASQGETRTHGFFYNAADGLLGLPIVGPGKSAARQLRRESASVLFLSNQQLKLTEVGALDSRPGGNSDGCRASCVDWYGNSRPLFLKGRVLALMGYELVEGAAPAASMAAPRGLHPALAFHCGQTVAAMGGGDAHLVFVAFCSRWPVVVFPYPGAAVYLVGFPPGRYRYHGAPARASSSRLGQLSWWEPPRRCD
jgi:hypothetical protein